MCRGQPSFDVEIEPFGSGGAQGMMMPGPLRQLVLSSGVE